MHKRMEASKEAIKSGKLPPYEQKIHQFLYLYRLFAFALGVGLIIGVLPETRDAFQVFLLLGLLGLYTILKVFAPFRWWQRDLVTHLVLWGDLVLSIFAVLFTGGLDSGLLLYSLTPIITAALLFKQGYAYLAAALSSLSLTVAHIGFSSISRYIAWILTANYLTLLILYTISCFIIATLAYRTNLNIQRRIEGDAILDERRRIGRETHDGVAQTLGYINLKMKQVRGLLSSHNMEQALSGLDEMQDVTKDAYDDIRESIDALTIKEDGLPLISILGEYVHDFGERNSIHVEFESPQAPLGLAPLAELQLLRIAQETLTNIRKHASASTVSVKLSNGPQGVEMVIRDDGRGFSTDESDADSAGHHGLNIIRERAENLGGALFIATAPGQGTEVRVALPRGI